MDPKLVHSTFQGIGHRGAFFERFLYFALLLEIALLPLPYASNRPFFWYFWGAYNGLLMTLWSLNQFSSKARPAVSFSRIWFISIPITLVFGWILLQTLMPRPEPHKWWYTLSASLSTEPLLQKVSVNPYETLIGLFRFLSYAIFFWLTLQLCTARRGYGKRLLKVVFYTAAVYAAYALLSYSLSPQIILFPHTEKTQNVSSTYMNRDHFATHMGMVVLVGLSLLFQQIRRHLKSHDVHSLPEMLRTVFSYNILYLLGCTVLLSALLLSLSRAGLVAACMGMALFFFCILFVQELKKVRKHLLVANLLIVALFLFLLQVGGHGASTRMLAAEEDLFLRSKIYKTTLRAIHDGYLLTGSGLGTFPEVYAGYVERDTIHFGFVDYAHNTYLENTLELGIVAFTVLLLPFVFVGFYALFVFLTWNNAQIYAIGLMGILLQAGAHAFLDFSFQIPAVMATFCAVAGIMLAEFMQRKRKVH